MEDVMFKDGFELNVKRLYLPTVIEVKCPKCGISHKEDLERYAISFPWVGEKTSIGCYCNDCETEFLFDVVIRLSLGVDKSTRAVE